MDKNTILFKKPKQYSQLNLHHKLTLHHEGAFTQNAYRYDEEKTKFIDDTVSQLLRDGTIQPSTGPWAAPVVVAKKKGGQLRFCVDYRRLNTQTIVDVFPMPDVKETLDALAHAKYFSVMDARAGYWQVLMEPLDVPKTGFVTRRGKYKWLVMPFGLINAPATF